MSGTRERFSGSSEVAVVTGTSSGVGRATVRELARRGARIALVARGRDGLALKTTRSAG